MGNFKIILVLFLISVFASHTNATLGCEICEGSTSGLIQLYCDLSCEDDDETLNKLALQIKQLLKYQNSTTDEIDRNKERILETQLDILKQRVLKSEQDLEKLRESIISGNDMNQQTLTGQALIDFHALEEQKRKELLDLEYQLMLREKNKKDKLDLEYQILMNNYYLRQQPLTGQAQDLGYQTYINKNSQTTQPQLLTGQAQDLGYQTYINRNSQTALAQPFTGQAFIDFIVFEIQKRIGNNYLKAPKQTSTGKNTIDRLFDEYGQLNHTLEMCYQSIKNCTQKLVSCNCPR